MSALRKKMKPGPRDANPIYPAHSTKIYDFAHKVFESTKGPTTDLKRVYAAYLANQKRTIKDV